MPLCKGERPQTRIPWTPRSSECSWERSGVSASWEVEAETRVFEKVGGSEEALTAGRAGGGCEAVAPLISPMRCGDGAHMDRSTGAKLWI